MVAVGCGREKWNSIEELQSGDSERVREVQNKGDWRVGTDGGGRGVTVHRASEGGVNRLSQFNHLERFTQS